MKRVDTPLPGVCFIEPHVFPDARGAFFETWSAPRFAALGLDVPFAQDNHVVSRRGVLRGLHWQIERPQAKLVRAVRGAIFDVAVDLRRGSPTFGRWFGATLTADDRRMLYVPVGFAHGYLALDDCEVLYKCGDVHHPPGERGLSWRDPTIAIDWPLPAGAPPLLSPRDAALPELAAIPADDLFTHRP